MGEKPKGKHGGARPGAGRKRGGHNALALGEVSAVKACKLRIPEDTAPEAEALAHRALQRVIDVMEGNVWHTQAPHVLKASTHIREEVCGPVEKKLKVSGSVSIAVVDPYAEKKE